MPRIITLQLEVTDEEANALVTRFANQANAYNTGAAEEDDGDTGESVTGDTDRRGVPWHADYHAATKTVTKAGDWKKKKGADPAAIEKYESLFLGAAPATAETVNPAELPSFVTGGVSAAPAATPAPNMPGMPGLPAATLPQTPEVPKPVSYDDMLNVYGEALQKHGEAKLVPAVHELYQRLGISDVNILTTDETARRQVVEGLRAL